jgi:hypothetical protein
MKLSVKGLAIAAGIGWALAMLLTGLANLAWPPYGEGFLTMMASVYPGYDGPSGIGSVIVAALYALVDGAVCGAVLAWLYNTVTR